MDITIYPKILHGTITAIPSKSQAHRLLICSAFADTQTTLHCPTTSQDIEATVQCLRELGAKINRTEHGYEILPCCTFPDTATLNCHESGSTLRFFLPIVGALGIDTNFILEGRLAQRPLTPLWEEMERMGCRLSRPTRNSVRCQGQLRNGIYHIDGGVSSQFITGLLFALSLMKGTNKLEIHGKIESAPYIEMTKEALKLFQVDCSTLGGQILHSPGSIYVEGDWSNSAFFLAANHLGSHLQITNLNPNSLQGDRTIAKLLPMLEKDNHTISVADIPDLVPILAVFSAWNHGAVFTDIQRLHLKESDRVTSTVEMITQLGGVASATHNTLTVLPKPLVGGFVNSYHDHRIAMASAIAATKCTQPTTILHAEAVDKSYPQFWTEYRKLGGNYEQYIR